jgi:LacI family transcriptional regulator
VEAALLELDYQPDAVARSLRRGETLTIGLIVPNLEIPFFASVAYSIERAAAAHGYSIILGNSDWEHDRESILLQNLIARQVDGLICISAGMSVAQIEPLVNVGTPVVTFERKLLDSGLDAVSIDNYKGACLATEHLLELGHRRIAIITGRAMSTVSEERLEGHYDALRDAGIVPDPDIVFAGDYLPETGKLAAQKILSLQERPTAIFAFNDLMAMGAMRVLAEHDLSVPAEIAIMGFDDIPMCQYTNPTLTTMRQPLDNMGSFAVDLLLQRIRSEEHYKAKHIRLQPELIIRASTGRPSLLQREPFSKRVANA